MRSDFVIRNEGEEKILRHYHTAAAVMGFPEVWADEYAREEIINDRLKWAKHELKSKRRKIKKNENDFLKPFIESENNKIRFEKAGSYYLKDKNLLDRFVKDKRLKIIAEGSHFITYKYIN